jgi:dihydrofolate reductase
MPARFVYWINASLDGFVEAEAGEHSGVEGPEWLRIDETVHREFNRRARAMTLSVEGRIVHDMMDPFWPDARTDESLPAYMREYGEIWTEQPKILVSRSRTAADHNTRIIGRDEDAIDELARIRDESEGDVGVGGPSIATQLLDAGLLDELMVFTHPAVLGRGRPLFDPPASGARGPLLFDLVEQQRWDTGVTLHRYELRR